MYLTFMTRKPIAIETSELRKRVRATIDRSRRAAAIRRERMEQAAAAYEDLLEHVATPITRMLANVLKAEGYHFTVHTPKGGLRLASATSGEDFIELGLDTSQDEPSVVVRVNRARGRRTFQHERPLVNGRAVESLGEEDVLAALLDELGPFVER
jgi:hypothetical protein